MIIPTGRPPRRSGSMCGGRRPPAWRWMMPGSTRRRWCTGGTGSRRSERPHRINEAVAKVIGADRGAEGRRRRAVDSTILADAVATQDTVTQLVSAIRRVAREVPGAAEQIAEVCTGHDYSRPGKPKIDWDDPAAKDALVLRAGQRRERGGGGVRRRVSWRSGPPPRWRCWPWSPGRTSSPPRAATGPTGGGGSPARSPGTG